MTVLAAPLGILAFLNLLFSAGFALLPADLGSCHGNREMPRKPTDQPMACHATMNCAENRKARASS